MIDLAQFRANIGVFYAKGFCFSSHKNKWDILAQFFSKNSFLLLLFICLMCLYFTKNIGFHCIKNAIKIHRTVLFLTICFYYFRAAKYLFICVDVSINPGPSFADSFFKFCHWNCNSISAHNFSRVGLIQAYNALHNFNIIAITETALTPDVPDEKLNIPGYNVLRNDLPPQDSHGGVMIYYKNDLPIKRRLDLEGHPNILVAELSISKKKVFFVLVYRKYGQSSDDFSIYIQNLNIILEKIDAENPYCTILAGDFNAHLNAWWEGDTDDTFGTSTQQIFNDNGFIQLVNQPTYLTQHGRTCIDLVATDQPNFIMDCDIHPSLHTNCHHQVNFVKLNISCPPPPPYNRRLWHYERADPVLIQQAIYNYDWANNLANFASIDLQIQHFTETLLNIMKNFIPFDDRLIRPKDPPWITRNVKAFYNMYKRKYKAFIRNGSQVCQKASIDALRQEYSTIVEKSQEKYLKSLGETLANPQTGAKKYWSALKKLLKKNLTSVIPPILQDNIFVTDIEEKCNIFNNYFKEQCKTVVTDSTIPHNITRITNATLRNVHFTEENILEHIRGLNINKAHGCDDITSRMLKMCDKSVTKPLFIIYKNCIMQGYFPKAWKMANVTPIHKKNNKNVITNYRPVSLLPICGKILEKLIFDNLYKHIYANNLISDRQSGYKQGDSTIKQLLSITNDIYKAFDETPTKEVRAVFLDISRAFDRVWHEGLIYKLKQNGLEGDFINIISSFLQNRKQRVVMDGKFSNWAEIEAGVPQGSILGPILFLVYINDLIDCVDSEIRIFADDTFIFRVVDENSTTKLNQDLEKITEWANQWKMIFNPDITKAAVEITFSRKRTPSQFETLMFNNIPVKQAVETKHLGMILDSKLNFKKHISEKLAKANQGLGVMKQLSKWVPSHTLQQIFKLYTRPHLDYGDILYDISDLSKTMVFPPITSCQLMEEIEKIQYKAALIVTGAWQGTSRDKIYDDLGWESLQNRRTARKLCMLYEIQKTNFPFYLANMLDPFKYRPNSRFYNSLYLKNMHCKTNAVKASFLPSVIRDWNSLQFTSKSAVSKLAFKNKVFKQIRPPRKSYFGVDKEICKHISQLRMQLSPLRAHKFKYNFNDTPDPFCIVCESIENTEHYLLHCRSYRLARAELSQKISLIIGSSFEQLPTKSKLRILLYGQDKLDVEKNKMILEEVGTYICKSKRLNTHRGEGGG